jgi:hypothetical protein
MLRPRGVIGDAAANYTSEQFPTIDGRPRRRSHCIWHYLAATAARGRTRNDLCLRSPVYVTMAPTLVSHQGQTATETLDFRSSRRFNPYRRNDFSTKPSKSAIFLQCDTRTGSRGKPFASVEQQIAISQIFSTLKDDYEVEIWHIRPHG